MAYASPTTINATNGIAEIFQYLNVITLNWLGRLIVIAIFVIIFMGYLRSKADEDFAGAFALASFVTFILSFLLFLINLLDGWGFGVVIGVTGISALVLFIDRRGNQ